eukprot:15744535-Heterocapsa_arctica.AAC.1
MIDSHVADIELALQAANDIRSFANHSGHELAHVDQQIDNEVLALTWHAAQLATHARSFMRSLSVMRGWDYKPATKCMPNR